MLCHSVRSLRSPVFLSFQESVVARVKLTTPVAGIELGHLRVLAEIADQNDFVDAAAMMLSFDAVGPLSRSRAGGRPDPHSAAKSSPYDRRHPVLRATFSREREKRYMAPSVVHSREFGAVALSALNRMGASLRSVFVLAQAKARRKPFRAISRRFL